MKAITTIFLVTLFILSCSVNNDVNLDETLSKSPFLQTMQKSDSVDCWTMYVEYRLDPDNKDFQMGQYMYGPLEFWGKDSIYYFCDERYDGMRKSFIGNFLGVLPYKEQAGDSIQLGIQNYSNYLELDSMHIEYKRSDRIWIDTLELFIIRSHYRKRRISTKELLKAYEFEPNVPPLTDYKEFYPA